MTAYIRLTMRSKGDVKADIEPEAYKKEEMPAVN